MLSLLHCLAFYVLFSLVASLTAGRTVLVLLFMCLVGLLDERQEGLEGLLTRVQTELVKHFISEVVSMIYGVELMSSLHLS